MNLIQLLASGAGSGNLDGLEDIAATAYEKFIKVVHVVMPVVLAIVIAFGLIYGIVLGIAFAKAEDAEQRDKAKGRLINMVIGVLVAVVIISIVYAILGNATFIKNLFPKDAPTWDTGTAA